MAGRILNRPTLLRQVGLSGDAKDHDLLVALYRSHGLALASRLTGAVAWILWDGPGKRLIAARDRLGEHELFFVPSADGVAVGDNARVLAMAGRNFCRPDLKRLAQQIARIEPGPDRSYYEGVTVVHPGSVLVIKRGTVEQRRYWSLDGSLREAPLSPSDAVAAIRSTLTEVATDFFTGSPSGIALSGGLDSPSVAAAARRAHADRDFPCFLWFSSLHPDADESPCAEQVAQRLGLSTVSLPIQSTWDDSALPLSRPNSPERLGYAECWAATFGEARNQGLEVMATGTGGDQIFLASRVATGLDLLLEGDWRRFGAEWSHWRRQGRSLSSVVRGELWKPLRWVLWPPTADVVSSVPWLRSKWQRKVRAEVARSRPPGPLHVAPARRFQVQELVDRRISGPLAYLRCLGSSFGVEPRHPFLDHRFLELGARLPLWELRRPRHLKPLLRDAFADVLPPCVLERRRKFSLVPVIDWALRGPLMPRIEPLLHDMRAAELGLVDEAELRRSVEGFRCGGPQIPFWDTITIEDWLRRWF